MLQAHKKVTTPVNHRFYSSRIVAAKQLLMWQSGPWVKTIARKLFHINGYMVARVGLEPTKS